MDSTTTNSRLDNPSLPRQQLWMAAAMLFFLAGTNGSPLWWSSAVPSFFLATALIFMRRLNIVSKAALTRRNRQVSSLLFIILITSSFSTLINLEIVSLQTLILRCIVPFLVYLSLVGLQLRSRDNMLLLIALTLGASIPFARGVYMFYSEWGIPDLEEFLWARYDLLRMDSYMVATFGNVGHMGSYAVLVIPSIILGALSATRIRSIQIGFLLIAALGVANIFISGSRTSLIISAFAFLLTVLRLGVWRGRLAVVVTLGLCLLTILTNLIEIILGETLIDRFLPEFGSRGIDGSIDDRFISINIGWDTFLDNSVFGVGPGMSPSYNVHSVPHQSVVHLLSELGLLGGGAFAMLSGIVVFRVCFCALRVRGYEYEKWRFIWMIGPACWLAFGLIGGITFNMGLALLWVGIAHAMLALSEADVLHQ